ncbi:MAG: cytochrome C assembly protein [Chloroflexi bacterium]|nr:MAG: cytochrome C assembly protein [Chloroflexota bacterium]MBL1194189.1 cytochrome C assembly protein [Chloroflexota bacterium]NOH11481.1 cytochrome c biogenesis protein CcsA [Chloroflexota bacterium]
METKPRLLTILDWSSIILFLFATGMVFIYAPMEAVLGNVQRVFYFHVAAGWVGMVALGVAVVAAIAYLRTSDRKWDIIGLASIEIGLVFSFINIISGAIWARPIWNTWWTWDPRLVTATIMELIYLAYLMLRQGIEDPDRRARFGAVYAIVGFLSVPLSFFSIRIWRTIHPTVVGSSDAGAEGAFDMTPRMLQTFFFSLFVFTIIGIDLIWHRIRLGRLEDDVEQRKMQVMA